MLIVLFIVLIISFEFISIYFIDLMIINWMMN